MLPPSPCKSVPDMVDIAAFGVLVRLLSPPLGVVGVVVFDSPVHVVAATVGDVVATVVVPPLLDRASCSPTDVSQRAHHGRTEQRCTPTDRSQRVYGRHRKCDCGYRLLSTPPR